MRVGKVETRRLLHESSTYGRHRKLKHDQRPGGLITGDEEMTGAQRSYLQTLCEEAGEEFDPNLTKAEASKRIEELQQQTGRGIDH